MSSSGVRSPSVEAVLDAAVEALGGARRDGQVAMAEAVAEAFASGTHLLVQAGTGTGKSLAYLVPAFLHARRVVVATATLALQHQLVERDLPRLAKAVGTMPGVDASFAVMKGRANYACLHRVREGAPDEDGTLSFETAMTEQGRKVKELRDWAEAEAEEGGSGDRDAAPTHTDREWRQVSVTARECLGASACPFGDECFTERARAKAGLAHVVVTNHAMLAIDALEDMALLPEYDAVVVDEAHELGNRVTNAATGELATGDLERLARRARRLVAGSSDDPAGDLEDAASALRLVLDRTPQGRVDAPEQELLDALTLVRDALRALLSALPKVDAEGTPDATVAQVRGDADGLLEVASRIANRSESQVVWVTVPQTSDGRSLAPRLYIAPLSVSGQMREKLLSAATMVFTSATLMLGGSFDAVARSVGLQPEDRGRQPETGVHPWTGLDVGSPFDYGRQGILYIARHLPRPGRDGLSEGQLDELVGLIDAAQGRALGLFSSRRAAEVAAEAVRARLPHLTTLAQGDAQLAELTAQFVADPHTVLLGTLSLWQGLDVPGDTCQLVVIDRIPFPRPDDPLMSARAEAVARAGGNGFMSVSATHAALLLAQGAGRLIRTVDDRGVVAVLDSRLATERYGSFLRASLPPFWTTFDGDVARAALARLAGA